MLVHFFAFAAVSAFGLSLGMLLVVKAISPAR